MMEFSCESEIAATGALTGFEVEGPVPGDACAAGVGATAERGWGGRGGVGGADYGLGLRRSDGRLGREKLDPQKNYQHGKQRGAKNPQLRRFHAGLLRSTHECTSSGIGS